MKHFLEPLSLPQNASWNQIREAYRDQMRVWHPDRFAGNARLHVKAEAMTKEIHYALRRLKELRSDLEKQRHQVEDDEPFLKQYYLKTSGGKGDHGKITPEDRSNGYLQDSFGCWETAAGIAPQKAQRIANSSAAASERRSRKQTVILRRKSSGSVPAFLASAGFLIVVASIGAIRVPQMLKHGGSGDAQQNAAPASAATRQQVKGLLAESAPNYQKKMDRRAKLAVIEKRKRERMPSLVGAAMNCQTQHLDSLLGGSAELNAADSSGQTALMWAAKRNCPAAVRLLVERGANSKVRSSNGFTALRWAKWYKNDDAIHAFDALGVKD